MKSANSFRSIFYRNVLAQRIPHNPRSSAVDAFLKAFWLKIKLRQAEITGTRLRVDTEPGRKSPPLHALRAAFSQTTS